MRIELRLEGDLRASLGSLATGLKNAVDAGTDKAARQTKDFARVVMRQALGARAANTIGLKAWPDPVKPLAEGLYSRWWRQQQDIPYAFSVGTTVYPKSSKFLAVPATLNRFGDAGQRGGAGGNAGTSYASGQVDTNWMVPGGMAGTSPGQAVNRRMNPRVFEYATGLKLRYVPPTGGRRFGLLVADAYGFTPKTGRLRRGQPKRPRVTVVAFLLLPRTNVPQLLQWGPVLDYAAAQLETNVLDAVQVAVEGGVPQYSVVVR